MNSYQFEYLTSDNNAYVGTVECNGHRLSIHAHGLKADKEYHIYMYLKEKDIFSLCGNTVANIVGSIEFSENLTGHPNQSYCIVEKDTHHILLYTQHFPVTRGKEYIWALKEKAGPKHRRSIMKHRRRKHQNAFGDRKSQDNTEINHRISVDVLPEIIWPDRFRNVAYYFEKALQRHISEGFGIGWCFICVPCDEHSCSKYCYLGKCTKDDCVATIAYIIPDEAIIHPEGVRGYKHQKTPDGAGVWCYVDTIL